MKIILLTHENASRYVEELSRKDESVITDDVDYVLIARKPLTREEEWALYYIVDRLTVYASKCYETDDELICITYHA